MEEGFLLMAISEKLGGGPRIVISPRTSSIPDDGKLISTDRFPNRRGLLALGFVEAERLEDACDGLIVARADAVAKGDAVGGKEWAAALESAVAVLVLSDRVSESTGYADQFLAIASHFEADASFVNRGGRLQHASPAVAPPGNAVEGWRALAALLAALGGPKYATYREVLDGILARLRTGDSGITAAIPS
jgi:NADH dehydrogenase/NADH:ubiquinone oxidoreductase subunit G